jgi:hypothetical protein
LSIFITNIFFFFIYRILIHLPFSRFIRRKNFIHRTNSAKLGQPVVKNSHDSHQYRIIHFGPPKRSVTCPESQNDSFIKSAEEHYNTFHNRYQPTSSTSISRTNREHQPFTVVMTKKNEDAYVTLSRTSDLQRYTKEKRRSFWSIRPQITL